MRALVNEKSMVLFGFTLRHFRRFVRAESLFDRPSQNCCAKMQISPLDTFVMVVLLARCKPDALTSWIASIEAPTLVGIARSVVLSVNPVFEAQRRRNTF
jgi:hypothetical protein